MKKSRYCDSQILSILKQVEPEPDRTLSDHLDRVQPDLRDGFLVSLGTQLLT